MSKTYTCKICNTQCCRIATHVKSVHKMDPKAYYDTYCKKDDNEEICPVCGNKNTFLGITYGYRHHCSVSCSSSDKNVQAKNKATNLKRYGVEHNWNIGSLRKNCENTMLRRYGVRHNWQTGDLRAKDNAAKASELEQYFMHRLNTINTKYEFQYYSEEYPYLCDFYLPDYKQYIEIHGSGFHMGHIFDKNNQDDVKLLKHLKEKSSTSSWYASAARIWMSDYEKYQIAVKNNLNYTVLWSDDDIDDFIDKLKQAQEVEVQDIES